MMKNKLTLLSVAALAASMNLSVSLVALADPVGSIFTYQGTLQREGAAAQGAFDFEFRLTAGPGSNAVPFAIQNLYALPVSNGVFSAELDYGTGYFNGDARYLEVAVRATGSGAEFTTLWPRTPLRPVPYALHALNATTAQTAQSVPWSALTGVPENVTTGSTYTAGPGLLLNGQQFLLNFSGNGTEPIAARADHVHFGQAWTGNHSVAGLDIRNAQSSGNGLIGRQGVGGDLPFPIVAGVYGTSADGDGVVGASGFRGVWGRATGTAGENYGVSGYSPSPQGYGVQGTSANVGVQGSGPKAGVLGATETGSGVIGRATDSIAVNFGVFGQTASRQGFGVLGVASTTNGANYGVGGVSYSTLGRGVEGRATADAGTNFGGWFRNDAPAGAAVHAEATSSAPGVAARSHYGPAGHFEVTNKISGGSALRAENSGQGHAGEFRVLNAASTKHAVVAWNNGDGDGVNSFISGDGDAGYFFTSGTGAGVAAHSSGGNGLEAGSSSGSAILAASGTAAKPTVDATHTGGGAAVHGYSASGRGLSGVALAGTGVYAKSTTGAALEIAAGALKVSGAGVNTGTTVFVHECNDSNTPTSGASVAERYTYIDNPLCNFRPDAILTVTPRRSLSDTGDILGSIPPVAVAYHAGYNKWAIVNDSLDEFGDFDHGDRFNVMVVLP